VQPTIERPWSIRIPYFDVTLYEEAEDPEKHFTMKELKAQTREEFLALVRARLAKSERFKDHALVFVHGYNTTFDNGVYRTAQIAYDLKFDGAPFLYSWPSGGGLSSYTYDRESAGQSVPYMREFLDLVIKETGAKKVSVIAHSMGNQPALQVLRDIKASSPPGVVISQIILAAPDVDRDNFENIAKDIQGLADGITLYAASNDFALGVSRRFNGGVPRAGDVPDGVPLVLPGIDTIDVTAVSTDSFGLNHSGYAENNALINDLQLLIQTGERPPKKRVPILDVIGTPAGDFWRYPVTP
jgi:esterase/lipase superfamily enzyme